MNSSIKVLLLSLIVSTGVFNSSGFTHVNFRLPEGYSQLEYLESTGAQRILLSTPIGPNYSVKMNFRPTTYKAMTAFFGYAWNRSQYLLNWQSDQYMFHSSGNTLAPVPGSIGKDCCFEVTTESANNLKLTIDDTLYTATGTLDRGSGSFYIFGCAGNNNASFRLYDFKVWLKGNLVHHFVPATNSVTGKIGIFDVANSSDANAFLVNSNSGANFIPGPIFSSRLFIEEEIPPQRIIPNAAYPVLSGVVVTDLTTDEVLTEGVDYIVSYSNNTAPGVAIAEFTGIGNYEGEILKKEFKLYDAGPVTPYLGLSRSYVPGGLVGFWDGIDNSGTGVHNPAATVWKDLSGYGFDGTMNGIATWANGNAMRNDADGNPCVLPEALTSKLTFHTATWEFAFQPKTLDTTGIIFSNYKPSTYGMIVSHNNGTTFKDGALRHYRRKDSTVGDVKLDSKVNANELAYFTIADETTHIQAWRDSNASSFYDGNQNAQQNTANSFIIGGRYDQPTQALRGDIRFLRVYNRLLTAKEKAFNRALDRIRHENLSLKWALPADLPDGYEYDSANDALKVRISANAIASKGLVSINGGEASKIPSAWIKVGESVTLTYHGEGFVGWTNMPSSYSYPNAADERVVNFTAGAPICITSLATDSVGESSITAYSYVQKGLLSLFDGIDNAGTGFHDVKTSTAWVDLTGSGRKWTLRNSGSWGANNLILGGSRDSAFTKHPIPSYLTAEFCAKIDSGMYLFSNCDDQDRIFIVRTDFGGFGAQRYMVNNVQRACDYGESELIRAGNANTLAAVYRDSAASRLNGLIDYYVNGSEVPIGCSPCTGWNMGAYPALGSRYDNTESTVAGSLYSIRFYSRPLEPVEVAFNAALDRIRFFGADEETTLANMTLPDGYRWNSEKRCLEVMYDIVAKGGAASLESGTYFKVGTKVTVTFTPEKGTKVRWTGLPLKAEKSSDDRTVTFTAAAPAKISVYAEQELPALTYISKGLIGLWDAKENVAPGVHDNLSFKWYDLTGQQQHPWDLIRGRAAFREDALEVWGCINNSHPLHMANLLPDWNTIEASITPYRTNAFTQVVNNRYTSRLLYMNASPAGNYFGGANGSPATLAKVSSPMGLMRKTYTVSYNQSGSAPENFFVNGEKISNLATGNISVDGNNDYLALGARYNNAIDRFVGLFNVLRIYSRPLDATEAAFNAAVDKIRFDGLSLAEALPETLPDGYRFDAARNLLEVRIDVVVTEGTVTVNGSNEGSVWVPVGENVTFVYTPTEGRGLRDWAGLPGNAVKSNGAKKVTFTAASPVEAVVETAATTAMPFSAYISDGLIASWDGLDETGTTDGWGASGELDRRVNAIAFDGKTYISNFVSGVTAALNDKSMTVEMFIRPRCFNWTAAYIHIGNGANVRDLILSMQGDRDTTYLKAQRGAFGALQYAATTSMNLQYAGIGKDTRGYFGQDTSVAIVRYGEGAKVAFNDEGFCLDNTAYNGRATTDQVNIGTWFGNRNAVFDLYAVRIYKRVLTDAELAYNRALDRARFSGAEMVLPEGYINDDGVIKAKYSVSVSDGSGLVSINGGEAAASVEAYLELGSTASIAYTPSAGKVVGGWTGIPDNASYNGGGASVSLKVNGPINATVTGESLSYSDDNFDSTAALPVSVAVGNARAYTFNPGTISLSAKHDLTIEQALVVGGGGAGGNRAGGGGGGGGVIHVAKKVFVPAGSSIKVEVGAGGSPSTSNGGAGGKGASSFLHAGDINIEAFGGGGGGAWLSTAPSSGGSIASSGGSANKNTTAHIDGLNYDSTQGHSGGISINNNTYNVYGPGGGGSFWQGFSTESSASGRNGGQGSPYFIGAEVGVYGAGGGGGGTLGGIGGINAGAGGNGTDTTAHGGAGVNGFGAGGGGGGNNDSTRGGAGGAGAVILSIVEGDTTAKNLEVSLPEKIIYVGLPVTPEVVVKLDGVTLKKDIDYTVTYNNCETYGFGGVLVTGIAGTQAEGLSATRAFVIYKGIFAAETGAGTQDGTSWANAMAPQAALSGAENTHNEGCLAAVLFKSGTYPIPAALTLSRPGFVLGGFLGEEGVSLELDESNPETVFDGQGIPSKVSSIEQALTVGASFVDCTNIIERCSFGRCYLHGFVKTGGSSIIFRNCRFFNNSWGPSPKRSKGRGFCLTGTKDAIAIFEDCESSGNMTLGTTGRLIDTDPGFGGYITTFKRVYIDNCLFVTNGWVQNWRTARGSALYVDNAPLTMRNTRIVANQLSHPGTGGTLCLVNDCGGSAFTNCLWVANANRHYGSFGNGGNSGALYVNFPSADKTIDIDHCTFAYNLQGSKEYFENNNFQFCSAAGLNVICAKVKVRNSIFFGNAISSENRAAADVYIHSGSADIDYTLFGGLSTFYLKSYSGATITLGEHIIVGDPNFVTKPDEVKNLVNEPSNFSIPCTSSTCTKIYYKSTATAALIDAHVVTDAAKYSPAIDGSIPSWPVGEESEPNGGIANLGFYGTTSEAAPSILGVPTIDGDVQVSFSPESAGPSVSFRLGGDGTPYNATAKLEITGDGKSWVHELVGLQQGSEILVHCPEAFTPGASLTVNVVVSAPGQADVVKSLNVNAVGEVPPWYGHGGDPNKVVHVRAGSTALNPRGTSWADAFPDFSRAYSALTSTRNEIWFAGTISHTVAPDYFRNGYPAIIRGGFTGVEDSADERVDGATSTIDGNMRFTCFYLHNQGKLTVERVDFRNGFSRAFYRGDSSGDLEFIDCGFYNNGATDATAISGAAVYFYRSAHPAANLAFRSCRFEGNGRRATSNALLDGPCIYVNKAQKSLTVEDSIFLTNGAPYSLTSIGTGDVRPVGTCVYAVDTPVTITGCRFAGNRACNYKTENHGGIIYLKGLCGGSRIANCAFVGNESVTRTGNAADAGTIGGAVVINLDQKVREVSVENCTFAWNLASGNIVPTDLLAYVGTVNVKNSIFYGGVRRAAATDAGNYGKYMHTTGNGVINLSYSMFDIDIEEAVKGTGPVTIDESCMVNNPLFVSGDTLNLTVRSSTVPGMAYDAGMEKIAATGDVHLVTVAGYLDNDGVLHTGGDAVSPAIDAGDPADDCSLEPHPNGNFINLGAYGNTAEASRTYSVEPEIADNLVTITFPNNTSFPKIDFDLKAAQLDYTAIVNVLCGTNGFDNTTFRSPALPVRGGEHFSYLQKTEPYKSGSTLYVRVLVTSGDHVLTNDTTITVTGEMPPWWGKGGGDGIIHVWADATGANNGTNWRDAYTDLDAAVAALDARTKEIWIAGNWYLTTGSYNFTPSRSIAIRGGFTAVENTPDERPSNSASVIDGNNQYNPIVINNTLGISAEVDRLVLYNSYDRGIHKTGGGDLSVISCTFLTNGVHGTKNQGNGKGISITSASGAHVFVTNTLFMGNMLIDEVYDGSTGQGNGSGIYIDSGASLTVVDCRFNGNGHPSVTPSTSHSGNPRSGTFSGGAIYSTVPTHISYSRFCGNRVIHETGGGGTVVLTSSANGSTLKNCLFAANQDTRNWSSNGTPVSDKGGALVVSLGNAAYTVDIENCTFAYNLCDGKYCAAGLTVTAGSVNVKNCVFGGNMIGANASDKSVDINVRSGASCYVSYTLLSQDGALRSTDVATVCQAGGTFELGEGVLYGDALFVTPVLSVTNLVHNFDGSKPKIMYFDPAKKPDWMMQNFDAHVLSESGYFNNAGEELQAEEGVLSPAIDKGDPLDSLRDEYVAPENMIINMGAYGGTRWASKSAIGLAEIDGDVKITFPTEFTRPQIEFTVGGEGTFIANATVYISSDGGKTWDHISEPIGNLIRGQAVSYLVPLVYPPNTELIAEVVLTANGISKNAISQNTSAEGKLPSWYGHGGDPTKVVHVREGAFGSGDGTSWGDAVTSFHKGISLLTAERNELWFAGTNVVAGASTAYNFDFPVLIRGGFDATEDSIEERKDGVKSLLTAKFLADNLKLENSQKVYIERIVFSEGQTRNFIKNNSKGDLAFSECEFVDGCSTSSGTGGYFEGDSGKTANLSFTNCVFRNNKYDYGASYVSNQSGSKAAYFKNFASVTIDGCLFKDNGTGFARVNYLSSAKAAIFEATGCRLNVANTRFVANSIFVGGSGGHILLQTGTGGSVFRNCCFVGNISANDDTFGPSAGNVSGYGGIIYVTGDFEECPEITIDHCTFAYNLAGSYGCPGVIYVQRGIVNVANSIFHSNKLSTENICPADVFVNYEQDDPDGAQCHISYSMVDDLGTNNIRAVSGGIITTNNVYVADPLLVTTMDDLLGCLPDCSVSGARLSLNRNQLRFINNAETLEKLEAFNVHLRSRGGWYDEFTGAWRNTTGASSPALDRGDPTADYSQEPDRAGVGFPGRRVNLGAYGNTPWASMTPHPGSIIIIR